MVGRKSTLLGVVLSFLLLAPQGQASFYLYSIGNSLTVDSDSFGMAEVAAARGISIIPDRHMRGSASLLQLWENANSPHEPPVWAGPFPQAFTNYAWDAVVLQPFNDPLEGPGNVITTIVNFMNLAKSSNPANLNTQFYIFARWPEQSVHVPNYETAWKEPYAHGDYPSVSADYFEQLMAAIHLAQPAEMKPVKLVPTGWVFAEIDRQIRAGELTGYASISEFYRDGIHLSPIGNHVASMTVFASVFGQDPTGLGLPVWYPPLNIEYLDELQGIVWDVVQTTTPEPSMGSLFALLLTHGRAFRRKKIRGRS